jgi:hypothetical protein
MRQSRKITSAWPEPLPASISVASPISSPGVPASTRNAEMAPLGLSERVRANTVKRPATGALVM